MCSYGVDGDMEIIRKACSILQNNFAFSYSTVQMQLSFFDGVSEEDYIKLDYKLKALRQDFTKILVTMNSIDRIYSAYQKDKYIPTYLSIGNDQATSELGCLIEYLFIKYRVLLDYIQQISEICIYPRLSDAQKDAYEKLKKTYEKYNFLLEYISKNIKQKNQLLDTKWFNQLRVERNSILHDGATCLVFGDKQDLLFKVETIDALDKEDELKQDSFFVNNTGLVYYNRYWGLQISKLIVFIETVFDFILKDAKTSDDSKFLLKYIQGKDRFVGEDKELCSIQDVLTYMLYSIIKD